MAKTSPIFLLINPPLIQSFKICSFPHLTIRENIAYRNCDRQTVRKCNKKRSGENACPHPNAISANKLPDQISGGQNNASPSPGSQVNNPQVLLLDEPFSAHDLNFVKRFFLTSTKFMTKWGSLPVRHPRPNGSMAVSDRSASYTKATLNRSAVPCKSMRHLKAVFVADFIGDTNFLDGTVAEMVHKDYSLIELDHFPNVLCFNDKQLSVEIPSI